MNGRGFSIRLAAPVLVAGALLLWSSPALAAPTSLTATLSGSNEVGKAGDPKASGSVTVTADSASGQVCATVTSDIANAAAMHIHKGASGTNGPVVVPFDAKKINAGADCVTVAPAIAAQIAGNPAGYYFNIHTPTLPAGAIRGQLAAQATSVGAGSGGQAATGSHGDSTLLVLLVLAGAGLVGAAGWRLARR